MRDVDVYPFLLDIQKNLVGIGGNLVNPKIKLPLGDGLYMLVLPIPLW